MADDVRIKAPDDLYQRDFYAWTQAQAEALRTGALDRVDWPRVAEEIGDMGARDKRECTSRMRIILEHFWKLESSKMTEPRRGWLETILRERDDLSDALTPSLRPLVEAELERQHQRAFSRVQRSLAEHEPSAQADPDRRWTFGQVMGEENDPLG